MKGERIKQVINERNIPSLVHFTNTKNLESIFTHGLVPRLLLDLVDCDYERNDEIRLDGHPGSVSLSVAFPNSKMFYKLWKNSNDKFCVLVLDPELLVHHESAFCKHNAACSTISRQSIAGLKTPDAFRGMFGDLPAPDRSRADQKLSDYYPSDVQAEILVFDQIPVKYIKAIVFPEQEMKKQYKSVTGDCPSVVHPYDDGFYGLRRTAKVYC